MTIAQLKETMSYQEYIEWQEYYNEEPFLADRLELQLAKIGYTNLATGLGKIDLGFEDFLVSRHEIQKKESKVDLSTQLLKTFGVKDICQNNQ